MGRAVAMLTLTAEHVQLPEEEQLNDVDYILSIRALTHDLDDDGAGHGVIEMTLARIAALAVVQVAEQHRVPVERVLEQIGMAAVRSRERDDE